MVCVSLSFILLSYSICLFVFVQEDCSIEICVLAEALLHALLVKGVPNFLILRVLDDSILMNLRSLQKHAHCLGNLLWLIFFFECYSIILFFYHLAL